jgi:hypothetical protein
VGNYERWQTTRAPSADEAANRLRLPLAACAGILFFEFTFLTRGRPTFDPHTHCPGSR